MAQKAVISTISLNDIRPAKYQDNCSPGDLQYGLDLIDLAVCDKPDCICLPEMFAQINLPLTPETAEPRDGKIIDAVSEKARKYNCYIVCPILLKDLRGIFNSAFLIDRKGRIVAGYNKTHPTIGEIQTGIKPGKDYPVFETDFGKIGIATCFDINFFDVGKQLRDKGAEIIIFVSMFDGGMVLNFWAFQLQCYIASAVCNGLGKIVNPIGQTVKQAQLHQPVISSGINLDYMVCHADGRDKLLAAKHKYKDTFNFLISSPEARVLLWSDSNKVSIGEIAKEFEIELTKDYYRRSLEAIEAAR